jgi:hypothetical protein
MEKYGKVDAQIYVFLTLALFGGEWTASRPGHFIPTPRERTLSKLLT